MVNIRIYPDYTGTSINTENDEACTKEHVRELEVLLEKAPMVLTQTHESDSSSDESSSEDGASSQSEFEQNSFGRLHCYTSCLTELAPTIEKHILYLQYKQEKQDPPKEEVFHVSESARPFVLRIFDRCVNLCGGFCL
jgi:hypothetical protein